MATRLKVNVQESYIKILIILGSLTIFGFNCAPIISLIILIYQLFHIHKNRFKYNHIVWMLLILLMIGIINVIVCYRRYNDNLFTGLTGLYALLIPFGYNLGLDYFNNDEKRENIIGFVINCFTILCILAFVQRVTGVNIFPYTFRNGSIRIRGISLGFFAQILVFSKIISNNFKKSDIIKALIMLLYLVFISQSRGGVITLSFSFLYVIMKRIWRKKNITSILRTLILIITVFSVFIILNNIGYIDKVMSFTTEIIEKSGSGSARIGELEFYYSKLLKNPFWGIGIIKGGTSLETKIYGMDIWYFIDDTGLMGFVFQTGIVGAAWLFTLFVLIIRRIVKLLKIQNSQSTVIAYALTMVIITSVIGFVFTDYILSKNSSFLFFLLLSMADSTINENEDLILKGGGFYEDSNNYIPSCD